MPHFDEAPLCLRRLIKVINDAKLKNDLTNIRVTKVKVHPTHPAASAALRRPQLKSNVRLSSANYRGLDRPALVRH